MYTPVASKARVANAGIGALDARWVEKTSLLRCREKRVVVAFELGREEVDFQSVGELLVLVRG